VILESKLHDEIGAPRELAAQFATGCAGGSKMKQPRWFASLATLTEERFSRKGWLFS
jgi:hypothetical protein